MERAVRGATVRPCAREPLWRVHEGGESVCRTEGEREREVKCGDGQKV